jgi:protein AbiQ
MKFYTIDDGYLDHLRAADPKVPNSLGPTYTKKKPYLGVLLNVDGNDFLAPLSSPKYWHAQVATSDVTMFKLYDRSDASISLGIISLSFMLPAPPHVLSYLDFSTQDPKYATLLQAQYEYIKTKWGKIQTKAEKIYNQVVINPKPYLAGKTCDFAKLITHSSTYPVAADIDEIAEIDYSNP